MGYFGVLGAPNVVKSRWNAMILQIIFFLNKCYLYINVRRSRDGAFVRGGRPCGVRSGGVLE